MKSNLRLNFFIAPAMVLATFFLGCHEDSQIGIDKEKVLNSTNAKIIINSADCTPITDPDLIIENAVVEQNRLKLTIRYGGGCGTVENELLTCGSFLESNPIQLPIFLSHKDNDPCEALIKRELYFDLLPVADLYKIQYVERDRVVVLNLSGFDGPIRYKF